MEKIVTSEIARLAKEVDYNEPCELYYDGHELSERSRMPTIYSNSDTSIKNFPDIYAAPTCTEIQTWLREEYGIDVFPIRELPKPHNAWVCEVSYLTGNPLNDKLHEVRDRIYPEHDRGVDESGTYDRAFEAGLVKGLKILNWNKLSIKKKEQWIINSERN